MDLFDKNETAQHVADLELKKRHRSGGESIVVPTKKPIRQSEKLALMVEVLKLGGLTTFRAETVVHRGQAVIGDLRSRGHVIHTISGEYIYERGPDDDLISTTKTLQNKYYATPHWRMMSKARREVDQWKCRQCESSKDLQVHHWRYRLFHEDVKDDLITFCESCHENIHNVLRGSSVHFPHKLTQEVIDRIEGQ